MLSLSCSTQQYDWGKRGDDSVVGQLLQKADSTITLNGPYAELWMGTHPSGPSKVKESQELLSVYLKNKDHLIGIVPPGYPNDDLPFLFKVLSINTALSIQAHPDKQLAIELHTKFPTVYKDNNHKPEMAIALTKFEAICGFRNHDEICENLLNYPELQDIIGVENVNEYISYIKLNTNDDVIIKEKLQKLFSAFMSRSDDETLAPLTSLISRLKQELIEITDSNKDYKIKELILRLYGDYPNDRGVLCPLFLNHLLLNEGEGFFMGANEPHAYIYGDCVECMALSDNVVRAGLTPKFRDVSTLLSMLTYNTSKPNMIESFKLDEYTSIYRPPKVMCAEFEVELIKLPSGLESYKLPSLPCASIVLIFKGSCLMKDLKDSNNESPTSVSEGDIYFVEATSNIIISISSNEVNEFTIIFRSHVNLG